MKKENQLLRHILMIEDDSTNGAKTTISVGLDIVHREYEQVDELSTLTIEILKWVELPNGAYDIKGRHTRVMVGNEGVERLLLTKTHTTLIC